MYSFSIRQFIWEHIGLERRFPLMSTVCIRFSIRQFHLGIDMCFLESSLLCIRFQLGNSFGNRYVFFGKFPLCNRFQLGNSFGNT